MLKFVVTKEEDLPQEEALKNLYTKVGDKWVLDVEGAVPQAQHDELKAKKKESDDKLAKYDLTPDQIAEIKSEKERLEKEGGKGGKKLSEEEIQAEVDKRVEKMKADHQREIEEKDQKIEKLDGDLHTIKIDQALIEAGAESGLRQTAHDDLSYRGRKQFKLDEHGNPVAVDKDGNVRYNKAGEPMSPKDFVGELTKSAPHLFETNQGGGSGGSGSSKNGSGGNAGSQNPWRADSFNLSEQSRIYREDKDQARQLAAAAGVTLQ